MEVDPKSAQKAAVDEKLAIGKGKKDQADELFKAGDTKGALVLYHQATFYIQGLDKSVLGAVQGGSGDGGEGKDKKTEADILLEKIYSNMCACHIKHENWRRAEESANQVLKRNPENTKASFRKGKALAGQGYTEKAIKLLEELSKKNPDDASIKAELVIIRAKDKEASAKGMSKFRGFLSKEKAAGVLDPTDHVEGVTQKLEKSRIEEVS